MGVFSFQTAKELQDNDVQTELVNAYENNASLTMTIPSDLRESLDIAPGDHLVVTENENGFRVEVLALE
jgi:AbrB family looped-hinge helix DNA binding protein